MRDFLESEMGQLKAGEVHTDLIHLKLGQIEDQVKLLLDRVRITSLFYNFVIMLSHVMKLSLCCHNITNLS